MAQPGHPVFKGSMKSVSTFTFKRTKWAKVFENGPSKICGRQPLKNLK